MKFINEGNFVSGVESQSQFEIVDASGEAVTTAKVENDDAPDLMDKKVAQQVKEEAKSKVAESKNGNGKKKNPIMRFIEILGNKVGNVVSVFFQS